MKKENLIAYASAFISFLLDNESSSSIKNIILFGSVARGDFDNESDIDIFIDSDKNIERDVEKTLKMFIGSEIQKRWMLKGLKHEISLKVGSLEEWKLKRSIISDGIMLYGKFKQIPDKVDYYSLISPSFSKLKRSQKVAIWRKLYGYKQKVGSKSYESKGIVDKLKGKRIETGIIVPAGSDKEIIDFLNKEKIPFKINEIWSDSF